MSRRHVRSVTSHPGRSGNENRARPVPSADSGGFPTGRSRTAQRRPQHCPSTACELPRAQTTPPSSSVAHPVRDDKRAPMWPPIAAPIGPLRIPVEPADGCEPIGPPRGGGRGASGVTLWRPGRKVGEACFGRSATACRSSHPRRRASTRSACTAINNSSTNATPFTSDATSRSSEAPCPSIDTRRSLQLTTTGPLAKRLRAQLRTGSRLERRAVFVRQVGAHDAHRRGGASSARPAVVAPSTAAAAGQHAAGSHRRGIRATIGRRSVDRANSSRSLVQQLTGPRSGN